LIGIAVIAFAVQQSLLPAFGLLLLLGVFGGFFIVPLNAGILIGIAVIAFAVQQSLLPAFGLLLLLGVFGGFF
ncbi:MFS transporter, partial [Klebsiella pneumoniae]